MTDLNRSDTQVQPLTVPVIGTPDGTYTAPGKDWDGAPVRLPLDDAAQEAGWAPNQKFAADYFNGIIGPIGQAVSTTLDGHAVNWTIPETATASPPFTVLGGRPFVAPGQWYTGIEREVLCVFNGTSTLLTSLDGRTWTVQTAAGFAEGLDDATAGHYTFGGDEWVTIIGYSEEGNGLFKATDDFGSNWYAAGSLPASVEDSEAHVMGYFEPAERFFWCARNQLYRFDAADDLSTDVEWTEISVSGWTGSPPAGPLCFAASPTECAISINGAPRMIRSSDGEAWAVANTGLTSDLIRIFWSADYALWFGIGEDNTLWTAPAGMATWTQRTTPENFAGAALGTFRDIATNGRTVCLLAGARCYVARDIDTPHWHDVGRYVTAGGTDNWQWAIPLNGALWVGHKAPSTALEHIQSGVLPSALARLGVF